MGGEWEEGSMVRRARYSLGCGFMHCSQRAARVVALKGGVRCRSGGWGGKRGKVRAMRGSRTGWKVLVGPTGYSENRGWH